MSTSSREGIEELLKGGSSPEPDGEIVEGFWPGEELSDVLEDDSDSDFLNGFIVP